MTLPLNIKLPENVAPAPVIFLTSISGVPVNPVASPVTPPVILPTNDVAVIIPTPLILLPVKSSVSPDAISCI